MSRPMARRITNEVRDHMRETEGWQTSYQVQRAINDGTTGLVRRSLNWLVQQGLLEKDSQDTQQIFRWKQERRDTK